MFALQILRIHKVSCEQEILIRLRETCMAASLKILPCLLFSYLPLLDSLNFQVKICYIYKVQHEDIISFNMHEVI